MSQVSTSLRELLQVPQISLEVLAGAVGLDKPVVWAHACEMSEPWDWVGPQELLLSIGYCVPRGREKQVQFVRRLAQGEVAGLVVSDDAPLPPLTKGMLRAADDVAFPILRTGHATPFSVIARAAASANQNEQLHRLARLSRLSTLLTKPDTGHRSALGRIADELGHHVYVLDATYGTEILHGPLPVDPRVSAAILTRAQPIGGRLPARLHIELGEQSATCFPVPSHHRSALLAVFDAEAHRMDPFAVLHVANLIAIEIERLSADYDKHRQRSDHLLRQLIAGRLDSESAADQLSRFGLAKDGMLAVALAKGYHVPDNILMDGSFSYLLTEDDGQEILLLHNSSVPPLVELLGPSTAIGTSDLIHSLTRIDDAVRAAKWALESAESQGGGHVSYGNTQQMFLPRTVTEAVGVVRSVLGEILDYDNDHGTELIRSLNAYLACDRSWKQAAEVLKIHRQTLGYRLNQIEALSARQLSHTADIAELWLALLALRLTDDLVSATPRSPTQR